MVRCVKAVPRRYALLPGPPSTEGPPLVSVNPERSAPVAHGIVVEELGRLVLCKRPIEVQYFAERTTLVDLARSSFPESPASASKLLDRLIAEAIDSIGIELVEDAADALNKARTMAELPA